jgi:CheY-like chemotaxis protein
VSQFSGCSLLHAPVNLVRYSFALRSRYRLWTMHILKRLFGRVAVAAVAEPAAAPLGAARLGAGRVLLAEDNFVNERVAVYMLTKLGYQVEVARHGREAIDMLGKSGYGIVLMDCQMPEMDGFEATRIIRDRSSAVLDHEIPVIAMTANAFPEDRARALACGMNDFLAKPVERPVLASMLEKWLQPASATEPRAAVG